MCSYTCLVDVDAAYKHLRHILCNSSWPNLFAVGERGRERKMFETDVNFGSTSAIAEMLAQSHARSIPLLPALPTALPDGSVKGLRARGGVAVDIEWANGQMKTATIKSINGSPCKLKYGKVLIEFETVSGQEYRIDSLLKRI
ncbi:hypothetical protein CA13_22090 [Planctomycetes bacterium CA13]|uniref:Alpha fucosidase A-like C-terminal domain-containing protein n=1 Tax=Novipirellula herctigrandis TaxID=2527986 RepID=A0A5C5Z2C7_9BACT|nr:hypothetical protein CA13_22090 [Planctomycetes bacterium CA13]